jgi:NDP-sugar pyrophosphorylase family protein
MDFLILCGGKATRLGTLAATIPKVLMDVGGRAFLLDLLDFYKPHADRILLLAGHLGEQLKPYASEHVEVILEPMPLDTGGAVLAVRDRLSKRFLVANGDTLFLGLDLAAFLSAAEGAPATAAIVRGPTAGRGHIEVHGCKAIHFREKAGPAEGWVYAGLSVFERGILSGFPEGPLSLERVVLPRLAEQRQLAVWPFRGELLDIGTLEGLHQFRQLNPNLLAAQNIH